MDGLFSPKQWTKALKAQGFKAHALTDHGTLAGTIPFYHAMRDEGIQPILGAEFYFSDQPTRKDEANRASAHMVLIAKNGEGWRNLLKLSKLSWTDGFYYKPRIGPEWLAAHSEGLICLSACIGGVLAREVWRERDNKTTLGLEDRYRQLSSIFGDDFYVEFQGHAGEEQSLINQSYYNRLRGLDGFQGVVTNDCHYILQEHAAVQDMIKKAAYGKSEAAQSYTTFDSLWLKKPGQMLDTFSENQNLPRRFVIECMQATEEIAEKTAKFGFPKKRYLPKYSETEDSAQLFKSLTTTALAAFLKDETVLKYATRGGYIARFKKEYGVITKHGLADYFLIVWDIIRWAESKEIYVGIGRGSSAGSFIAYLLRIVKINPLQYGLIFERMLNDNRCENGELPDVDMDFESERRDEVKQYIYNRYGADRVCEIGTYGRMMLKTAIVDFGKQYGFSVKELLEITTSLDLDKTELQSLDAAMDSSPKLKAMMRKNTSYAASVRAINGQIKSQSIHPAGLLIASESIDEITPLKTQKRGTGKDEKRILVTQSEDKWVISQGLAKIDVLGLKEYDIFKFVVNHSNKRLTAQNYFEKIIGAELKSPDARVWEMFHSGKTDAVFQFSSDGMKRLLIDMKADCIADLIAAVALYRPGCLANNWHTRYYKCKHGEEEVVYPHPSLEVALGDTYGVPIYQEQVMLCIHILGEISLVDADTIRSALGKKDEAKLAQFKDQFVKGAKKKVGSEEEAGEIWDQLAKSAGYSFNLSHSAVYGLVAYCSQWMKVHETVPYWTAVLCWGTRKKKWNEILSNKKAAAEMGVIPMMPDINASKVYFTVENERPRWSLSGVAGIGPKVAQEIMDHQPFTSVKDFFDRVHKGRVKFNNMVDLVYSGAFDSLGDRCEQLKWLYDQKKDKACPKLTPEVMLKEYYRVIGFFERRLGEVFDFDRRIQTEADVVETIAGEPCFVGGMVSNVSTFKTKKGDAMGRVTIVDLDERIDLTFFPTSWACYRSLLREGRLIEVSGSKSDFGGKENQVEVKSCTAIDMGGGEGKKEIDYDSLDLDDIPF